jgi:DNA repair protein RecN (Recombination protein N)
MIFDEIDVGVSGSVADRMGQMIVDMGETMQVIAITHLPQVASKGDAHFLVYKEFDDDRTASSKIRLIEGEERVREIARMLSGRDLTEEALANARVLLAK